MLRSEPRENRTEPSITTQRLTTAAAILVAAAGIVGAYFTSLSLLDLASSNATPALLSGAGVFIAGAGAAIAIGAREVRTNIGNWLLSRTTSRYREVPSQDHGPTTSPTDVTVDITPAYTTDTHTSPPSRVTFTPIHPRIPSTSLHPIPGEEKQISVNSHQMNQYDNEI